MPTTATRHTRAGAGTGAPAPDSPLANAGHAVLPALLQPAECRALRALYAEDAHFRSTVTMARHGFGRGEYRYFRYPLPEAVATLRERLYAQLAGIANAWRGACGREAPFPATLAPFLDECRAAGQCQPTPLLLRYGPGDYNCLHRDLYGDVHFPVQVAVLLSQPEREFSGGEFVLSEQRPRRQSRATVVPLGQGDAVAFAVSQFPVDGTHRPARATLRHGVSTVRDGERFVLGLVFHDAR
ncbi:MAG: 2OG-Fe(II) oxygenase [Proteobacteria bacterium]|nr:2OG-Fe(II) oxygenase [Pseudomonadota bacterium]